MFKWEGQHQHCLAMYQRSGSKQTPNTNLNQENIGVSTTRGEVIHTLTVFFIFSMKLVSLEAGALETEEENWIRLLH